MTTKQPSEPSGFAIGHSGPASLQTTDVNNGHNTQNNSTSHMNSGSNESTNDDDDASNDDRVQADDDKADGTAPSEVPPVTPKGTGQAWMGHSHTTSVGTELQLGFKELAVDTSSPSPAQDFQTAVLDLDLSDYESDLDANESDIDIADDDDNYDDVDKVSVASDGSDRDEAAIEAEIIAAGEDGIDWDHKDTWGWSSGISHAHYSLDVEIDYQDSPLGDELLSTFSPGPSSSVDLAVRPSDNPYSQTTKIDDDSSNSSSSEASEKAADGQASNDASNAEDGDTTDDDLPEVHVSPRNLNKMPSRQIGWINDASSRRSSTASDDSATDDSTSNRSSSSKKEHAKDKKKRALLKPVLRKLKFSPNKALAYTLNSPNGVRLTYFELSKGTKLRWVSAGPSRTSTPTTSRRHSTDAPRIDGLLGARANIDGVLQGRLFQQAYCSPQPALPAPESEVVGEFARNPLLNGFSRALYFNSDLHPGSLMVYGEFIDDDMEDDDVLQLIDFDGGQDSDGDMSAEPSTPTPVNGRRMLQESAHIDEPSKRRDWGDVLAQSASDEDDDNDIDAQAMLLDDINSNAPRSTPSAPTSSPNKRRASSRNTSTSPILKRQRVGVSKEVAV